MNEQAVFHGAKATPWKKYAAIAAILAVLALGMYFLFWGAVNPITPQSVKAVVTPVIPASAVVTPLPPAPAASAPVVAPVTACECKCECCAKKVSKPPKKVKKPIRKPVVKKVAPAPRYVPPVYNKPTIKNPETGKMVPTMPLGVQPVTACNNQTTGGVSCVKR